MKILVHPHALHLGGSQTNAIELAAAVRDLGHDVTIMAHHGSLLPRIEELDLEFIQLGKAGKPQRSMTNIPAMRRAMRHRDYDVLHAYEFRGCREAWAALGLRRAPSLLCTDMSMKVHERFPRTVPLIVGTRALMEEAEHLGVESVFTIEPPVDASANHPSIDGRRFSLDHRLQDRALKVVIVSRLARQLKLEGIERTINAIATLARDSMIQLVIVGDGECYADLQERACTVNTRMGRDVVILTGPMIDPRPAYAIADVVVGMGHSVLRGMAFAKPAVVVGEDGFSEIVSPVSIDCFRQAGFYSRGSDGDPQRRLCGQLSELMGNASRRRQLGLFGREIAVSEYSLSAAARRLETIYEGMARRRSLDDRWLVDTGSLIMSVANEKANHLRSRTARTLRADR